MAAVRERVARALLEPDGILRWAVRVRDAWSDWTRESLSVLNATQWVTKGGAVTTERGRGTYERSGLLVTALLAGAAAELAVATAVASSLGLRPLHAVAAGTAVTLGVSTLAALALGALLGRSRSRPAPPRVITLPEPISLARRDVLELVEATERRLLRAVEVGAPEAELMDCALDLHAARLRLARVLLAEDGALPQSLKDELLVARRGTSDWLRSPRLS